MDSEEMVRILEEIIRADDTNPTARCTAIRTLREIAPEPPMAEGLADLYGLTPRGRPTVRGKKGNGHQG